jgi:hypothetical protein
MLLGRESFWNNYVFKNDELFEYYSVALTVGVFFEALYGFWKYTNNAIGEESIYLNMAISNFLKNTKFNLYPTNQLREICFFVQL